MWSTARVFAVCFSARSLAANHGSSRRAAPGAGFLQAAAMADKSRVVHVLKRPDRDRKDPDMLAAVSLLNCCVQSENRGGVHHFPLSYWALMTCVRISHRTFHYLLLIVLVLVPQPSGWFC